jgi:hypothetical protein
MTLNYIKYNQNFLPSPTPMVTISKEIKSNRKKTGAIEKIELNGQITGNNFLELQSGQKYLTDIFSENFKELEIYERNNSNIDEKIYNKNYITINSINFKESNYNKIVDYSISLTSEDFLYNVNNPINEFSFNQSQDKTSLVHKISAEGINTNSGYSNALNNAIEFVKNYSGLSSIPSTLFITGEKYSLNSFKESIDRINSKYEIQESYILSNYSGGVLQYSLDASSGAKNNFINVSLQGNYSCGLNQSIDNFENNINYYNIATGLFSGYLNPIILEFSLTKNNEKNTISFNCLFNNDNRPNPYIEYKITKNKNYLYDVTETIVEGELIYRGHQKAKITEAEALNSTPNFNNFGFLKNLNISKTNLGKFNFSKTYSNQNLPANFTEGNYSLGVKPSLIIRKYVPSAVAPCYYIQNFQGYSLEKIQLQGSFKGSGIRNFYGSEGMNLENITVNTSSYDPTEKVWQYNLEGYTASQVLPPLELGIQSSSTVQNQFPGFIII